MNTKRILKSVFGGLLLLVFTTHYTIAQTYQLNNGVSSMRVDGTSNLHDWDIKAENQKGKIALDVENGKVTKINELQITVLAESLKSGKSAMDKNTHKALKTGKHKDITFVLSNVKSLDCSDGGSCKVTVNGNLSIAGVTKPMDIVFDLKVTSSSVVVSGNKKFKMSTFNVDPPTAMFGTITTGDEVDVVFNTTFSK